MIILREKFKKSDPPSPRISHQESEYEKCGLVVSIFAKSGLDAPGNFLGQNL